jgi:cytochrome c oxidase assembly protein subunit 15
MERKSAGAASRALHRFALLTAGTTFLLIIAGGLVVGFEAGLAVPDWPLSFGTWMPPMVGGVFYEHGHRMIAGTVGVLTTVLAVWLAWRDPRPWLKGVGIAAWAAVVVQAILGGLTVLYLLPIPILIAHAGLAQVFFCLVLSLALFTSPAWEHASQAQEPIPTGFPSLAATATAALFFQLLLGAALRHNALGVMPHVMGAVVASCLVGLVCYQAITGFSERDALRKAARWVGGILALQLVLGVLSYFSRLATPSAVFSQTTVVIVTTAHVATGALLLGGNLILTLLARRRMADSGRQGSLAGSPQRTLA